MRMILGSLLLALFVMTWATTALWHDSGPAKSGPSTPRLALAQTSTEARNTAKGQPADPDAETMSLQKADLRHQPRREDPEPIWLHAPVTNGRPASPDELWEILQEVEARLENLEQEHDGDYYELGNPLWMPGGRYNMIRPRDEGSDVVWLQKKLHQLGEYNGAVDGVYSNITRRAVEQFQHRHNLDVDGVVGPQTRSMIYQLLLR